MTYLNNLYWTPRFYQASGLSNEFENEILKFKNLHVWEDKHVLALTQLILIEATETLHSTCLSGLKPIHQLFANIMAVLTAYYIKGTQRGTLLKKAKDRWTKMELAFH